jgi:hypothetical protein
MKKTAESLLSLMLPFWFVVTFAVFTQVNLSKYINNSLVEFLSVVLIIGYLVKCFIDVRNEKSLAGKAFTAIVYAIGLAIMIYLMMNKK